MVRIPGGNILNTALRVIARQPFDYYAFVSRTTNVVGNDVANYADPLSLTGSVQPVPRNLYANMGLDFQKNYLNFFVERNIIDITRDVSGDYFIFNGRKFQCLSKTAWYAMDGWDQVLTVEVEPDEEEAP